MSQDDDRSSVDAARDALSNLPSAWLECRDLKHAWITEKDFHVTETAGRTILGIQRDLKCIRCSTIRHETFVPSPLWGLQKTSSHYTYPPGYQIHGLPQRVSPSRLVAEERYHRVIDQHLEAVLENAEMPGDTP